jgi:hypothetical protein
MTQKQSVARLSKNWTNQSLKIGHDMGMVDGFSTRTSGHSEKTDFGMVAAVIF